jgi:hypothetical protein
MAYPRYFFYPVSVVFHQPLSQVLLIFPSLTANPARVFMFGAFSVVFSFLLSLRLVVFHLFFRRRAGRAGQGYLLQ